MLSAKGNGLFLSLVVSYGSLVGESEKVEDRDDWEELLSELMLVLDRVLSRSRLDLRHLQ